jgi:membrane peptidoglycan carboxypeptidase
VGILPGPNAFNPVHQLRCGGVLPRSRARAHGGPGHGEPGGGRRARRSRIEISPEATRQLQSTRAPYFYSYIFQELETVLGESLAREGKFLVQTGLDLTCNGWRKMP